MIYFTAGRGKMKCLRIVSFCILLAAGQTALCRTPTVESPTNPEASAVSASNSGALAGAAARSGSTSNSESGAVSSSNIGPVTVTQGPVNGTATSTSSSSTGPASATSGDSSSTVTFNHARDRRQAPGLGVPSVFGSGPCLGGASLGVSVPGAAVAGGKTSKDDECGIRETARLADGLGANLLGQAVLCSSRYVSALDGRVGAAAYCEKVYIALAADTPFDESRVTIDTEAARLSDLQALEARMIERQDKMFKRGVSK